MEEIGQFLPIILAVAAVFLFLILPQQRKAKQHTALLNSLSEGSEVILNSGVHGFVGAVENEIVWLEIAEDTEIKVLKSAIASVVNNTEQD